jgi:Plavaka transposase
LAETRQYEFWNRSLWDWGVSLVQNKTLANMFEWEPVRLEIFNGENWERFVTESWTAEDWHDIQVRFTLDILSDVTDHYKNRNLLLVATAFLYALSSTQIRQSCRRLEKLKVTRSMQDSQICRMLFETGRALVGLALSDGFLLSVLFHSCTLATTDFRQVTEDPNEKGKLDWVNFKRVVWHECFRKLLASIKEYATTGCPIECGDGVTRNLFPCVLILSGDYEEQCVDCSLATTGI